MTISRRRFLTTGAAVGATAVGAAAAAAQNAALRGTQVAARAAAATGAPAASPPAGHPLATPPAAAAAPAATSALPLPADSGIDHVIMLMMENRSFDHYLGWLPGADGRQAGLTFTDRNGVSHATHHLQQFNGCGHPDPDHSFAGERIDFNGGRCDGWLRAGQNDIFAIGYYTAGDLPFLGKAALDWTVCDRYFSPVMAPTIPNRIYQHAAQTDRIQQSSTPICKLLTIWDRLAAAGVSGRYYFSDAPFTSLWGTRHLGISRPIGQFYAQAAAGTLPAVSFVDPRFAGEMQGVSGDEHPLGDIRAGQAFIDKVYEAVVASPAWPRTVLVIAYDEAGGFFDHVPPQVAPDANPAWGLRGFRVPCVVISPLARRGYVAHNTYDHTSVLKLIEWRWGLAPLSPRDAAASNIAEVLSFGRPNLAAPRYQVPSFVPLPCGVTGQAGGMNGQSGGTNGQAGGGILQKISQFAAKHGIHLP